MMPKIGKIQFKPAFPEAHYFPHFAQERRFAVGRQTHNLVFVAIMGKAKILGQRLVEDSKRVREKHPTVHRDVLVHALAPSSARKISKAVDRDDRRVRKWRDVISGIKMAKMVFDI